MFVVTTIANQFHLKFELLAAKILWRKFCVPEVRTYLADKGIHIVFQVPHLSFYGSKRLWQI